MPARLAPYVIFIAGSYLLQPYYAMMELVDIHVLFERELMVLLGLQLLFT
ncbi:hypothetical protein [Bacillus kwashiorkori]|nr:hypothetical protein [Bacillus kwashiorkori]